MLGVFLDAPNALGAGSAHGPVPGLPLSRTLRVLTQPPCFASEVGMTHATRYSLGLVDLRPHRDAAHRPLGRAPPPGPAMYHIEQSLPPSVRNDTLSLIRAGAPMYPPPYVVCG